MCHWSTCSHSCPSLGGWLRDGSLLPMVSKEVVSSGDRPCPAQALPLPSRGSCCFLGETFMPAICALAARNQIIQSGPSLWKTVPVSAPASARSRRASHPHGLPLRRGLLPRKCKSYPRGEAGIMQVSDTPSSCTCPPRPPGIGPTRLLPACQGAPQEFVQQKMLARRSMGNTHPLSKI